MNWIYYILDIYNNIDQAFLIYYNEKLNQQILFLFFIILIITSLISVACFLFSHDKNDDKKVKYVLFSSVFFLNLFIAILMVWWLAIISILYFSRYLLFIFTNQKQIENIVDGVQNKSVFILNVNKKAFFAICELIPIIIVAIQLFLY